MNYDDVSNTICLKTNTGMLILNESDYELLVFIENGQMYMLNMFLLFIYLMCIKYYCLKYKYTDKITNS